MAGALREGRPPQESAGPSMVITSLVDQGKIGGEHILDGNKKSLTWIYMAIKFAKHTFAHFQNATLHRYLDSQYVTADDSVLSFLNLTEVSF